MLVEGSLGSQLKRLLVGKPIPSHLAHHERLSRPIGLAVLSSDALSSVAYATEEVLRVLILAGAASLGAASPISFVIAAILIIVVFSYSQTIHAYPSGGGAYIVGRDNTWSRSNSRCGTTRQHSRGGTTSSWCRSAAFSARWSRP